MRARAGCGFLPMLRRLVPDDPEGIVVTTGRRIRDAPSLFTLCYALFSLLRLFTSAVRGEGAQRRVKGRSRGKGAQQTVRRGPPRILGTAGREPHGVTGTTGATTPRDSPAMVRAGPRKLGPAQPRETHSRWCGRGSWGDPGRGRVRICCKGAPGRDRHREKARNINDSPRALQRDRGLCNRFGQPAPPGALPGDGRRLDGRRAGPGVRRHRGGQVPTGHPHAQTGFQTWPTTTWRASRSSRARPRVWPT